MIAQGAFRQTLTRPPVCECAGGGCRRAARVLEGLAGHVQTFGWEGIALGAHARLSLQHPDKSAAKSAIAACLEEVARLERIFSLHKSDSALARLNACGRLDAAPANLRALLSEALMLPSAAAVFDPTVQP